MWRVTRLMIAAAAALACAGLSEPARGQGKATKSDSVVKVKATADKPGDDGKQVVTVTLTVDKSWHIYANPVGLDDLADVQTKVTITGKAKPEKVDVTYPEGKVKKDAVVGNYNIYEGEVKIKATVQRAKGDAGPLEVSVKVQACNESQCLLPATVKVSVP